MRWLLSLVLAAAVGCGSLGSTGMGPSRTLEVTNEAYGPVTVYRYNGPPLMVRGLGHAERNRLIRSHMTPAGKLMPRESTCITLYREGETYFAFVGLGNSPFVIMTSPVIVNEVFPNWVWPLTGNEIGDQQNAIPGESCRK